MRISNYSVKYNALGIKRTPGQEPQIVDLEFSNKAAAERVVFYARKAGWSAQVVELRRPCITVQS